jgi:DNA-binding IclR family transcriptional regulator
MAEKLLHVSNATAHRYLNMLVVRGKLRREGRGRGVKYRAA